MLVRHSAELHIFTSISAAISLVLWFFVPEDTRARILVRNLKSDANSLCIHCCVLTILNISTTISRVSEFGDIKIETKTYLFEMIISYTEGCLSSANALTKSAAISTSSDLSDTKCWNIFGIAGFGSRPTRLSTDIISKMFLVHSLSKLVLSSYYIFANSLLPSNGFWFAWVKQRFLRRRVRDLRVSSSVTVLYGTIAERTSPKASRMFGYCSNLNGIWVLLLYSTSTLMANVT